MTIDQAIDTILSHQLASSPVARVALPLSEDVDLALGTNQYLVLREIIADDGHAVRYVYAVGDGGKALLYGLIYEADFCWHRLKPGSWQAEIMREAQALRKAEADHA
jgi:hypothetical protein